MTIFERAFSDTEKAADSTLNAVKSTERLAKALQKAAKEGNINAIKKVCSNLKDALGSLNQTVTNAVETWPFKDDEEEAYLRERYSKELQNIASEEGLKIHDEGDGRLIAYPSIVHVLPGDRTVRIDRKKVATLRPSRLTGILKEKQKKPPRFKPDVFLEALHKAYLLISRERTATLPVNDKAGPVKLLVEIYEALTLLPDSGREYDRTEFAKGIYLLDVAKTTLRTKKGARVSFPSSTGTKRAKDTFHFVGSDGNRVTYSGIQFFRGA